MTVHSSAAVASAGILAVMAFAVVPMVERAAGRPSTSPTTPPCVQSEPAVRTSDPTPEPVPDAGAFGIIRDLAYEGETNLIWTSGADALLREMLCDGLLKDAAEVKSVLAYVCTELEARGFRHVLLAPACAEAYHADTGLLELYAERDQTRLATVRKREKSFAEKACKQAARRVAEAQAAVASSEPAEAPTTAPAETDSPRPIRSAGVRSVRPPIAVRPQTPSKTVQPDPTEGTPPPLTTSLTDATLAAAAANGRDAVPIGVISKLALSGHLAFIQREKVSDLLTERLCDGCEKTVGELRAVLEEVRAKLVARGFLLVTIMPASKKAYHRETRTLDLTVDPGTYGDVDIKLKDGEDGFHGHATTRVAHYFRKLRPGDPFNYNDFRGALRDLNANPDLTADAELLVVPAGSNALYQAGTDDQHAAARAAAVKLSVDDSFPLHAALEFNNFAMKELGYWQASLMLQYLGLTGADDVFTLAPALTMNGGMWSLSASYRHPFTLWAGGSWAVYGGYSELRTTDATPNLGVLGLGGFAGANVSFNLWSDDRRTFALNVGLQWRYLSDEWRVEAYQMQDRSLHILPLTFGLSYADRKRDALGGLDYYSLGATVNLLADGGKFAAYSDNAAPNYWIFKSSWSRLWPLFGPDEDGEEWRCWSLFSRVDGQYAPNTLLTAERLALGGPTCLRGYRTRGYLGDSGAFGTLEFRTPVWCNLFREMDGSPLERLQFYAFTDLGGVFFHDATPEYAQKEFLWSAGLGLRFGLSRYLSVNFDAAFPLRRAYASEEDRTCEMYLSVKGQY